jgi:hypothetical protein
MRPPVAANGCPAASEDPLTLSLERSIDPRAPVQAEPGPAEVLVLPGLQGGQHGGGEGLVDLVVVEVLQRSGRCGRAAAARHTRGHEQALVAVDVVDAAVSPSTNQAWTVSPCSCRPLLAAQEDDRGAVGERGRVAGRHRGVLALAEGRLEGGELLHRGVGAQVLVRESPRKEVTRSSWKPLVVGGEVVVAHHGELVLGLAGDAPAPWRSAPCARPWTARCAARCCRDLDAEVGRADAGEGEELVLGALGPVDLEQFACAGFSLTVMGASEEVSTPPAMPESIWPSLILFATRIAASSPVPQACWMSYAGVVGARLEPRTDSRVRLKSRLCLMTAPATTSPTGAPPEPVAGDEPVEGRGEHVLVGGLGIRAELAGEGDAVAAEDGRRDEVSVTRLLGVGPPGRSARYPVRR